MASARAGLPWSIFASTLPPLSHRFHLCSAFPNRHFWYEFDALVLDGLRFLVRGCKKGPRGSKLTESSAEATPFTNASSSSGSGAAAASSGSGAAEGRSAYQTIGAASEGPAYADL
jgi:hypothetical protein